MTEETKRDDRLDQSVEDVQEFSANMMRVAAQSQKLLNEFMRRQGDNQTIVDPLNIGNAFMDLTARMMANPQTWVEKQVELWQDYMKLWHTTTMRMLGQDAAPVVDASRDKRFRHEDWQENQVFDFLKQSYLLAANFIQRSVTEVEGLSDEDRKKVDFYTRQFVDAMSPSNFVWTNPEVLKTTLEQKGENLVRGLDNMLKDLERGEGQLAITMTDLDAFEVGRNVAITPGKVVFENELFQLIQYAPTTEKVNRTPLLIFPPWINKFYILDLTEKKSFVRWAVAQGHTVFMVSWVNPDESYADHSLDDYMIDGQIKAMQVVEQITGERSVNCIGYCVAGTMLAATLAYLHAKGEQDRVKSATFFTAQVDFKDAGELTVFIDDEQLRYLENLTKDKGYLDSRAMATTFNMLRANDLIWSFVVNNYLLGKEPFPFDLLYWNSDSTNLPRTMHLQYLEQMYRHNKLVQPGALKLGGETIDLRAVKTPVYIQAGRDDHIAPAKSVYKMTQLLSGPIKFMLAGSGHIAGVVNPPEAQKYQYWTNSKLPESLEDWCADATETPGSWWPDWHKWIARKTGGKVPARIPGEAEGFPPIEDAPGRYVKAVSGLKTQAQAG
ncbi:MAG: PHA/PHB synthase family protein [Rhodothalassiaceae bacterium]